MSNFNFSFFKNKTKQTSCLYCLVATNFNSIKFPSVQVSSLAIAIQTESLKEITVVRKAMPLNRKNMMNIDKLKYTYCHQCQVKREIPVTKKNSFFSLLFVYL